MDFRIWIGVPAVALVLWLAWRWWAHGYRDLGFEELAERRRRLGRVD